MTRPKRVTGVSVCSVGAATFGGELVYFAAVSSGDRSLHGSLIVGAIFAALVPVFLLSLLHAATTSTTAATTRKLRFTQDPTSLAAAHAATSDGSGVGSCSEPAVTAVLPSRVPP